MRVLVTGATGLVGNNVVRQLLERGDDVRVLVRDPSDRALASLPIDVRQGGIEDRDAVVRACEGVEAVVHAAGSVHIGWTGYDAQHTANVKGTQIVAESARSANARLVHVSSVNALGLGTVDSPANEEGPLTGGIPCGYVLTKQEAERVVLTEVQAGLQAVIVNPGFMLGPWDWKPSSGKMLLGVAKRYTPAAPSGGCSVCDVRDVAAAILTALRSGRSGQRYILAGENLTYLELWARFRRATGGAPPVIRMGPLVRWIAGAWGDLQAKLSGRESDVNSAAIRMSSQFHYYSSQRAMKELGYQSRPLDESIRDAWAWFQERGYVR